MKPERIILTGANGRLARMLGSGLCTRGFEVVGVSRNPVASALSWDDFLHNFTLRPTDLIVHTAWSVLPLEAQRNPTRIESVDLPLLRSLLAKIDASGQAPALAFFSTAAVYGESLGPPFVETDRPSPRGVYAAGKLLAEQTLANWNPKIPSRVFRFRISNVYGFPFDPAKPQGVHARLLHCAETGEPFSLWGIDTTKDYLHVDDLLQGLLTVTEHAADGIWNLCQGESHSLKSLIRAVEDCAGKKITVLRQTPLETMEWDVRHALISNQKAAAIGFSPALSLAEGIDRMTRLHL